MAVSHFGQDCVCNRPSPKPKGGSVSSQYPPSRMCAHARKPAMVSKFDRAVHGCHSAAAHTVALLSCGASSCRCWGHAHACQFHCEMNPVGRIARRASEALRELSDCVRWRRGVLWPARGASKICFGRVTVLPLPLRSSSTVTLLCSCCHRSSTSSSRERELETLPRVLWLPLVFSSGLDCRARATWLLSSSLFTTTARQVPPSTAVPARTSLI